MNVYMDIEFKRWILGGVIREARSQTKTIVRVRYISTSRKKHPFKYFYTRYLRNITIKADDLIVNQRTLDYLLKHKFIAPADLSNLRCHFTHDTKENLVQSGLIEHLKKLKRVLVLNNSDRSMLIELGVEEKKVRAIYGAVDRKLFSPSEDFKKREFVLVTGDCKSRKNPKKILDVIKSNPDVMFIICGRFWKSYTKDLKVNNPNLMIRDFSMEENAYLMRAASAYMTLSLQEGGPFPVLEALASGTPVLSTPVGWVPEIIDSNNGRIVGQSDSIKEISHKLRECLDMKKIVSDRDLLKGKYTWQTLSKEFFETQIMDSGA